jgi:hypothetical protein
MPKRRENDPKRTINFEKMGKALGFYSHETDLGSRKLFSDTPGDTVHRVTSNYKNERLSPGKGHVSVLGAPLTSESTIRDLSNRTVIEGVSGISKNKKQ